LPEERPVVERPEKIVFAQIGLKADASVPHDWLIVRLRYANLTYGLDF